MILIGGRFGIVILETFGPNLVNSIKALEIGK